ncbi:hypothetical protein B0H10DRAFT_1963723 [Mycena sp. CBHHK59/15]|nr:hypothetical protein B0H10DRAFT_1963723 [Mycena sp. CBHHK59/15]
MSPIYWSQREEDERSTAVSPWVTSTGIDKHGKLWASIMQRMAVELMELLTEEKDDGLPTIPEIKVNISVCTEGEPVSTGPPVIIHCVLMMDKIAVEQRPRWDNKTDMILGACWECSHKVSLEFNMVADPEVFFNALDNRDTMAYIGLEIGLGTDIEFETPVA